MRRSHGGEIGRSYNPFRARLEADDAWHHLAVVVNADALTVEWFVDGVSCAAQATMAKCREVGCVWLSEVEKQELNTDTHCAQARPAAQGGTFLQGPADDATGESLVPLSLATPEEGCAMQTGRRGVFVEDTFEGVSALAVPSGRSCAAFFARLRSPSAWPSPRCSGACPSWTAGARTGRAW